MGTAASSSASSRVVCFLYRTSGHKSKISSASSSRKINSFCVNSDSNEHPLVCAAELTATYEVINHHQSFKSVDYSSKFDSLMYPDSRLAAKQYMARIKATAIILPPS